MMYTAQPLAGFNTFEQGAGEINIAGAVDLTSLIRTDINSTFQTGTPLLTGPVPTPSTTISTYTFQWSQGILLKQRYATGVNLIEVPGHL